MEFDEIATGKAKKLIRENAISKIDVKRSYEAARGNPKKMNKIIDEIIEMDVYTKDNLVRIGKENPKATASEIIKEAKKPVILKTVLIQLSSKTGKALNIASEELSEPPTSIAKKALEKWLDDNKFLGIDE
ncbi:MAG: hypothetical protein GY771_17375 [bacterium]|nr:hypothetical protein [bacterium]